MRPEQGELHSKLHFGVENTPHRISSRVKSLCLREGLLSAMNGKTFFLHWLIYRNTFQIGEMAENLVVHLSCITRYADASW